ncbi:MAG: hypothetical protein E7074_04035 [Bacteroidales bacterium]|nr:hypothetical protein [Bacteroidales bacterium]
MISSKTFDAFLALVRQGIGHESRVLSQEIDWTAIKALADTHGLSAVVLDGLNEVSKSNSQPSTLNSQLKLSWIGEVMQSYEGRYAAYEKAIGSLTGFYNQHGYKMMVLKGYASSLDWPNPKHRPCGDIDIWQFGKQKEADAVLAKEKGVKIDTSHHHHTVFEWDGFSVENHYDFINVHHHKSNAEFEKILKQLGEDDSHFVVLNGDTSTGSAAKVYLPSPNLHALFLLKHLMMHFASEGIMLRQVVDWGFFVEKHGKDVDWNYVLDVLDQFGMRQMFNIINAICVGDLGFDVAYFPTVQFEPNLKDRVLNEILVPKYSASVPKNIFSRVAFKIRRWRDNEWKHQLCYKDSMWSAFWSGVWNHLLKPSSI